MLREEFNSLVSERLYNGAPFDVGDSEYPVIETVYAWHPSISNADGKEQVADLYAKFGFVIFLDMLPRAKAMRDIEHRRMEIKESLNDLTREELFVRSSDLNETYDPELPFS